MARVSILVNGRSYEISCGDGEEENIFALAEILDSKVAELVGAVGQVGESRLLAMAGLLLADEVRELRAATVGALENGAVDEEIFVAEPAPETDAVSGVDVDAVIEIMETLAIRIETIAEHIEEA
ncbi:MAG: cell division protein ZapA [Alphaproteobacteria bacterium]|nr:cell division protein ZapA [Alphaproteobacteria bacterium]MBF0249438.1 cell division protein ZapA [Alphaproteobacteria bacterium]